MRWSILLSAAVLAASCGSAPDRATSPPGQPGAPCTLAPAGDEWAGCVQVSAELSRAPATGQPATLRVEVRAQRAGQVRIELDAPGSFTWTRTPPGTTRTRRTSSAPDEQGCVDTASGTWPVTAGRPLRIDAALVARTTGFATIRARATLADGSRSGTGAVHVTVGDRPGSSYFGYRADTRATPTSTPAPSPTC